MAILLPTDKTIVCVPTQVPNFFFTFWIPILIAECTYCVLALYQGLENYTSGDNMFQNGKRILGILVRDSLSYFVM